MLAYPALDLLHPLPLKAARLYMAVNAGFILFRDSNRRRRGYLRAMATRHELCAIERAAQAEPAATLILGTLLLLIRP
jgi:hypothetical protein